MGHMYRASKRCKTFVRARFITDGTAEHCKASIVRAVKQGGTDEVPSQHNGLVAN